MKSNNVAIIIYCLYKTERFNESIKYAKLIAVKAGKTPVVLCISNCNLNNSDIKNQVDVYLEHDNSNWEFGAWQKGLEYLKDNFCEASLYILTNDTFGIHYKITDQLLKKYCRGLSYVSKQNKASVAGMLDQAKYSFEIGDVFANHWLRTNFICLNKTALNIINWKIEDSSACDKFINKNAVKEDIFSNDLDVNLKKHLLSWISPSNSKQDSWYGANTLAQMPLNFLIQKIKSILQEILFTRKLIKHNIVIFNIAQPRYRSMLKNKIVKCYHLFTKFIVS